MTLSLLLSSQHNPTKLDKINKAGRKVGHKWKGAFVKPVVVPMETD